MEVQGMEVAHELTAWVVANPIQGSVSAAIKLRTPELGVALAGVGVAVIGVGVIGGALMLTWRLQRQQGAEFALTDDDGGRLAAVT